jgi:hypothetical protein
MRTESTAQRIAAGRGRGWERPWIVRARSLTVSRGPDESVRCPCRDHGRIVGSGANCKSGSAREVWAAETVCPVPLWHTGEMGVRRCPMSIPWEVWRRSAARILLTGLTTEDGIHHGDTEHTEDGNGGRRGDGDGKADGVCHRGPPASTDSCVSGQCNMTLRTGGEHTRTALPRAPTHVRAGSVT